MFLYLTEIFPSVQGETSFSGLPTTFIRLSGCNLRCSWCDTPYSFKRGEKFSLEAIQQKVQDFSCPHICITGGEPLLQKNVHCLMKNLCDLGYVISIETGGSLPIDTIDPRVHIILDIKCPTSKMEHKNYWENLKHISSKDEVKFVLSDEKDYCYAKQVCSEYEIGKKTPKILFSPVHGILPPQQLVEWILRDKLAVRLNLQLHKYIWTPTTRGV